MTNLILPILTMLLFSACKPNYKGLDLNKEYKESGEEENIQKIVSIMKNFHKKENPEKLSRRDAHAKHHACVRGDLVIDSNIPDEFRHGIFMQKKEYPVWIRFSNGSGKMKSDTEEDARGFALKVMNVDGEKLLEKEKSEKTQDFLMMNHNTFFVKTVKDYAEFSEKVAEGKPFSFFLSGNPFKWRLHEMGVVSAIKKKKVTDLLATQYFSAVPFLLGNKAVKYSVKPCTKSDYIPKNTTGENLLRENLNDYLSSKNGCFELMVQKQIDPNKMPIEDSTVEWDESMSPFAKIATLRIPKQKFDSEKQMEFCENLSFTPWHSLAEHKPIGGMNRVRKIVYEEISKQRHLINKAEIAEPSGKEKF
ncbi:MAG: catalase family protein [Leptospiraceae bacterium]|nr:catalase family protein [Leptospiraceae bacterium]